MRTNINFKAGIEADDVYVVNQVIPLHELTYRPNRKGLENAIISDGEIVNVVSKRYGHLSNQDYFPRVEEVLDRNDIAYQRRSINRDNRAFVVDYILNDERYHIDIKNGMDSLKPMLRFTNSYDGSCRTSGHFGFFREVCSNGLHVAHTQIGFKVKHTGNISNIVLPEISQLIRQFIDNEYYTLQRKFEVLAETPVKDMREYVQITAERLKLFKYESSEQNPEPSKNARIVMETMTREANLLGTDPNLWIGYNAFNELIHNKLRKPFEAQRAADSKLFELSMSMAQ